VVDGITAIGERWGREEWICGARRGGLGMVETLTGAKPVSGEEWYV
jgi:hypothetical protein